MERPSSSTSTSSVATRSAQATPHRVDRSTTAMAPSLDPTTPTRSPLRRMNKLTAEFSAAASASEVSGFALPQSPSLAEIHSFRSHVRTNSDVQGLVKRFEHLDVRDRDAESQERRRKHEAELRRAQIAREEAESDVKRLRVELRALKKEHDDSRERERKVARRLEVVVEEFANAKEAHAAGSGVYEKELRKIRKEAFKSSSTVVKLQEELKSTRNSLRIAQSGLDLERQKAQRREQETFHAQYQLVAVQEELEKLKTQLHAVRDERDALKTTLKEEEVARIAAEGMIALPNSQEDDEDLAASPRRQSPHKHVQPLMLEDKENLPSVPRKMLEFRKLEEDLRMEQLRRQQAEAMAEFLDLECVFHCCTCRANSQRSHLLAPPCPPEMGPILDQIRDDMRRVLNPRRTPSFAMSEDALIDTDCATVVHVSASEVDMHVDEAETQDVEERETPEESHVQAQASESNASNDEPMEDDAQDHSAFLGDRREEVFEMQSEEQATRTVSIPLKLSAPAPNPSTQQATATATATTPVRDHASFRTVTTTTTIPMQFTPVSKPPPAFYAENGENIPPQTEVSTDAPTFDRAAALAAIQYRRGRAKSIANGHATPRKQMMEGVSLTDRRDISAPALGGKVGSAPRVQATASVGRGRAGGRLA